jgi:hypothetical protein
MNIRPYLINGFGLSYLRTAEYIPSPEETLAQGTPKYVSGSEAEQQGREVQPITTPEVIPFSIDATKISFLGTPVWSDLQLKWGGNEVYFDTCLIDVTQTKNIVKTSVQGRNGTVKEYISDGDYVINIKGAIVNQGRNYPEDQVRNLVNMMKVNKELEAVSPLLTLFGIYNLVVEDYRLPSSEGFTNTQLVEINCISDTPIELVEDDQTNI